MLATSSLIFICIYVCVYVYIYIYVYIKYLLKLHENGASYSALLKVVLSGVEIQTFFTVLFLTLLWNWIRQNSNTCLPAEGERELQPCSNQCVWKQLKCLCVWLHAAWLDCTFDKARNSNSWLNQLRAECRGVCRTSDYIPLDPFGMVPAMDVHRCIICKV